MKNARTITALLSFPAREILESLQAKFHNWRVREKVRALDDLDERMLQDIGITREDIYWASRLPISINAAHELERATQLRRRSKAGAAVC